MHSATNMTLACDTLCVRRLPVTGKICLQDSEFAAAKLASAHAATGMKHTETWGSCAQVNPIT